MKTQLVLNQKQSAMKTTFFYMLIILVLLPIITKSQTPNFNHEIIINNSFSEDSTITPFNDDAMSGIGVTGSIILNSDSSFIRIIVNNILGEEYLIYETYTMLTDTNNFEFVSECEESCFLDGYIPIEIIIQVRDGYVNLYKILWSDDALTDPLSLQLQAKTNKNNEKINRLNNYIEENNLIWIADETSLSKLFYSEKKNRWGNKYQSYGYEYYDKGFYSIFGPDMDNVISYGYVDNFDWRNRHKANDPTSPYFDGDFDGGTGWMTKVVCHGRGCWLNNEFICNTSEDECNSMGGIYRTAPTCWAFGPTAQVEALVNLYYNEHVDVDLSEQYIVCEEGVITHGWYVDKALDHYKLEGVPDEECLHYSASLENCDDLCTNPDERIWIQNYTPHSNNSHQDVRQYLMEYGPVTGSWMNSPWGQWSHAMALVGWDVIDEDDLSIVGIEYPTSSEWYGQTYWIYKQSGGPEEHHDGFQYMLHWDDVQPKIHTIDQSITSLNRTDDDINCEDKDGDGYYFWGIGPKPAHCPPCPDFRDGDDSNPGLGPFDEYGICTVINSYTASFEENWDNWIQVGYDDQDWWRHSGPTETGNTGPESAQDGDYYIYTESSCNGCYPYKDYIIESPSIDLSEFCEAQIDFYYHQHIYLWGNPDDTRLEFQISDDGGDTWVDNYWFVEDDQGNEWHNQIIRFPSTVDKVRFILTTGVAYFSDVALDNITIGPSMPDETPLTIGANTSMTLDEDQTINSDIVIENGGILTIENCTISMNEFASIFVQQGGKLIVNDATIKCMCSYSMWQGIQVWGNSNQSQYCPPGGTCPQGKLELKNGATIENAVIAVDLWNPGDWSSTGGIVYADDAVFRNNAKSVHALHYRNFLPANPDLELDYFSNFEYCTFEITSGYPGDVTFYKHVDMSHVKGIDFQACDFSLTENVAGVSEWNSGIAAYDAKFSVSAICSSQQSPCPEEDYDKCTFAGFYSAVNASSDGSTTNTFHINKAVFNNNTYGVRVDHVSNEAVLFSDFYIGENKTKDTTDCSGTPGTGISIKDATGFALEENNFTKYAGAPSGNYIGISIYNTQAVDEVYKNNFTGLSYANYSDGKNWYLNNDWEGLAYFCNENIDNYADFYVADARPSGIQSSQGSEDEVTGNKFSPTGAIWHFYNGGDYRVHYYYCNYCDNETPENDLIYEVEKMPENFENLCPSHYENPTDSIILSPEQKLQAEQEYYDNLISYNNVKTLYDDLVDGGDTDAELLDIQSAQPDDMWALREQLLGDSPHLSQEALMETSDRTDVFPDDVLLEILSANPDELKKDTLLSYLENKEDPLPDYMIDILRQVATGITYKTTLQQQMARYNRNKTRAAHDIIRSILHDTISNYSELRNWLDNLGGLRADKQIIASYVQEGNFTDAVILANMLPQLYDLEGDQLIEHNYYIDMLILHDTLYQQSRNTQQLDSTEVAGLVLIADSSKGIAGAQAKSILESCYGYHFTFCPSLEGSVAYKNSVINMESFGTAYGLDITVKPNPAKQWAAFDYSLPTGVTSAIIIITDISGKTVATLSVNGKQGQKIWDTRHIVQGIYIYTLKAAGLRKSGKIIINK